MLGHWLVTGLVLTGDGGLHEASPLTALPGLAPLTWALQTLGLFFYRRVRLDPVARAPPGRARAVGWPVGCAGCSCPLWRCWGWAPPCCSPPPSPAPRTTRSPWRCGWRSVHCGSWCRWCSWSR